MILFVNLYSPNMFIGNFQKYIYMTILPFIRMDSFTSCLPMIRLVSSKARSSPFNHEWPENHSKISKEQHQVTTNQRPDKVKEQAFMYKPSIGPNFALIFTPWTNSAYCLIPDHEFIMELSIWVVQPNTKRRLFTMVISHEWLYTEHFTNRFWGSVLLWFLITRLFSDIFIQ